MPVIQGGTRRLYGDAWSRPFSPEIVPPPRKGVRECGVRV